MRIYRHCKSCAKCRDRRVDYEVRWYCVKRAFVSPRYVQSLPEWWAACSETVTSPHTLRFATGVTASVVLFGLLQVQSGVPNDQAVQSLRPVAVPTMIASDVRMPDEANDQQVREAQQAKETRIQPVNRGNDQTGWIVPTEPRRPFVFIMRTARLTSLPVLAIDPPPTSTQARIHFPVLPEDDAPALMPPPHKSWKRFFSAVSAPFRYIARASSD